MHNLQNEEYMLCAYEVNGVFLLYDYNGVIVEVNDELYYEACDFLKNQNKNGSHSDRLHRLLSSGVFSKRITDASNQSRKHSTAYLSFAPQYSCNLRCAYCFGEYGKKYTGKKRYFENHDIRKIIDFFTDELYPEYMSYRIDFVSGGEPLMRFEAIKEAVEYSKEKSKQIGKRISIWLCTNSLLLTDEIKKYLSDNNVSIGISIDGGKEAHDKKRIDVAGKGTYDRVVEQIKNIQKDESLSPKFKNIWALCTIANDNCKLKDILTHFKELGITNLQMRLVRDENNYNIQLLSNEYYQLMLFLIEKFEKGEDEYLELILNDNDQFGKVIKRIVLGSTVERRCYAGINKITICPDGEIYPCDSLVGIDEYKIGNIDSPQINKKFADQLGVSVRNKCKECQIREICGGDCYYHSYVKCSNVETPADDFCSLQHDLIRYAIYLKYYLYKNHSRRFERFIDRLAIKEEYRNIYG